jgi:hypothetical protein
VKKSNKQLNFPRLRMRLNDCVFFLVAVKVQENIFHPHLHIANLKYTFALPFWKEVVGKLETESL